MKSRSRRNDCARDRATLVCDMPTVEAISDSVKPQ
jgi:hypothetical protein